MGDSTINHGRIKLKSVRFRQSKLAKVVCAKELSRQFPSISKISVHPAVVESELVKKLGPVRKGIVYASQFVAGRRILTEAEGAPNFLWVAAGARGDGIFNGELYEPVGSVDNLDAIAAEERLAKELVCNPFLCSTMYFFGLMNRRATEINIGFRSDWIEENLC